MQVQEEEVEKKARGVKEQVEEVVRKVKGLKSGKRKRRWRLKSVG